MFPKLLNGKCLIIAVLMSMAIGKIWAETEATKTAATAGEMPAKEKKEVPTNMIKDVAQVPGAGMFNVCDFGAKGDGVALDTSAIQSAINACTENRGGTVVFPAGSYRSGTIFLKDNVTLHFATEATLLGSKDLKDYSEKTKSGIIYNTSVPLWDKTLIYAEKAKNIGFSGNGTIDGQGLAFPRYQVTPDGNKDLERPMLVRLVDCNGVTVRDINLRNSGCWCLNMISCKNIKIDGVRIRNQSNATNDGIDLERSRNVFISNCDIASFDDAIALKDGAIDVVITNCIISSFCAGIRIGPESVYDFENIAVSNCVIRDTYHCGIKLQVNQGGRMENLTFTNLVMENVTGPISVRLARWREKWMPDSYPGKTLKVGVLRNVLFSNIRARVTDKYPSRFDPAKNPELAELESAYLWALKKYGPAISCISITGLPDHYVTGLTFSNIHVTFPGGGTAQDAARRDVPDLIDDYPEYWMFGILPAYGLYAHHVKDLKLDNVRFDLAGPDERPAFICEDGQGLEISSFNFAASPSVESVIRLRDVRETFLHGGRMETSVPAFLRVEGKSSDNIFLSANELHLAKKVAITTEGAPRRAVVGGAP